MAKLSGYLSSQMANPAYGGMLSQNISGGMQGISDAIAQKKQRRAMQSQLAMLTGADPSDPRVQQSVQAVGQQMHQDPRVGQQLIDQQLQQQRRAKADARAEEQQAMAKERHEWSQATAQYQQGMRKREQEQRHWQTVIAGAAAKSDEAAQSALEAVPAEYRTAAEETYAGKKKFDSEMRGYKEEAKLREGFSKESLSEIAGRSEAMQQAVASYNKTKEVAPKKASENLITAMNDDARARLYRSSDSSKLPAQWEVKAAAEFINDNDLIPIENQATFMGYNVPFTGDVRPGLTETVARRVATRQKNDEGFVLTKESVSAIVGQVMQEAQSTTTEEARPTGRTATGPNGTIRELSDGTWVDEAGNKV